MPIKAFGDPSSYNEVVTAGDTITAQESGKTFILNSATALAMVLPTAAVGLNFKFIIGATEPTSASHTIKTASDATVIQGFVLEGTPGVDAGADEDTITFVVNLAKSGDYVTVECNDGTNWNVSGFTLGADGITLTDAPS